MPNKEQVAEELIRWHFQVEPGLIAVYRIISDNEDAPEEPIKLLEVNVATVSTGAFEAFGFAPTQDVPYPTLIAEVTPDELEQLRAAPGAIPAEWALSCARQYDREAA